MKRPGLSNRIQLASRQVAPQTPTPAGDPTNSMLANPQYLPAYRAVMRQRQPGNRLRAVRAAAGLPMAAKRQIRHAALSSSKSPELPSERRDQTCRATDSSGPCSACLNISFWKQSLRTLEGVYGSGVVSFFLFLKSMLALNLLLAVLLGVFVILPQAVSSGQQRGVLTGLLESNGTRTSGLCSEQYSANLTSAIAAGNLLARCLDVIQGTGMLEDTLLFIGHYFPSQLRIGAISYNMPLACLIVNGIGFFISLMFMLDRTGAAFKQTMVQRAQPSASGCRFSHLTLAAWDFGLSDKKAADLAKRVLRNGLVAELDLHELQQRHERAGSCASCCLIAKRILVNILVVGILCGSGFAIFAAQSASAAHTAKADVTSGSIVNLIYQYLPPVVLLLLGAVLPVGFDLLVRLEEYTPDAALAVTLGRCVLLRLAGLVVLVVSVFSIITCSDKDACGIGLEPACVRLPCWETYVGQAFYKLEISFFVAKLGLCFGLELPWALIGARVMRVGAPEFDISGAVLDVLYAQTIVWLGMLFCPFLPVMNAFVLLALFYLRLFSCHFCYKPPERPMKNSSAKAFFMITMFLAYFVSVAPVGYAILSIGTSKGCSPFRTGRVVYQAVTDLVGSFDSAGRHWAHYLGSASFLYLIIIALLIVIHYYRVLAIARRDIGEQRLQLLNEQEDIAFTRLRQRSADDNTDVGRVGNQQHPTAGSQYPVDASAIDEHVV